MREREERGGRRRMEISLQGSDGEEREEVDFAPSCKNSCGCPWMASASVRYNSPVNAQ